MNTPIGEGILRETRANYNAKLFTWAAVERFAYNLSPAGTLRVDLKSTVNKLSASRASCLARALPVLMNVTLRELAKGRGVLLVRLPVMLF